MKKEIIVSYYNGVWTWLYVENGKKIAIPPRAYSRKSGAERGAERFRRHLKNRREVKIVVKDRE